MADRYKTFREFYPFYLAEHRHPTCRRLHFVGTTIGVVCLLTAFVTGRAWYVIGGLVAGYLFAWIGHFFFEKNRPATFTHPWYSLLGDWVMFRDLLTGRLRF